MIIVFVLDLVAIIFAVHTMAKGWWYCSGWFFFLAVVGCFFMWKQRRKIEK